MRKDLKKRKEKSKRKKSFEDALPIHAGRCMKATTLPGGTVSAREYLYTCVSADAEKLRLSQVGLTHWSWQNIPSSSRQTNTPNKNTLLLKEERERERWAQGEQWRPVGQSQNCLGFFYYFKEGFVRGRRIRSKIFPWIWQAPFGSTRRQRDGPRRQSGTPKKQNSSSKGRANRGNGRRKIG